MITRRSLVGTPNARWLIAAAAALLACGQSDPAPFIPVRAFAVYSPPYGVAAGGGETALLAYSSYDGYGLQHLYVNRLEAADPSLFVRIGEYTSGGYHERLAISGDTVAWGTGSRIVVIDTAAPGAPVVTNVDLLESPGHVLATGELLLTALGARLELRRVSGGDAEGFDAPAAVTGLVASGGRFIAFTELGWAEVVPGAPSTFTHVTSDEVRGFRAIFNDGPQALAAGPSQVVGRSRVARLDLSGPPALVASWDVPVEYAGFAWDGGHTALIEAEGPPSAGIFEGYLLREAGSTMELQGVPLPGLWGYKDPHLAMWHGYLYRFADGAFRIDRVRSP